MKDHKLESLQFGKAFNKQSLPLVTMHADHNTSIYSTGLDLWNWAIIFFINDLCFNLMINSCRRHCCCCSLHASLVRNGHSQGFLWTGKWANPFLRHLLLNTPQFFLQCLYVLDCIPKYWSLVHLWQSINHVKTLVPYDLPEMYNRDCLVALNDVHRDLECTGVLTSSKMVQY